MTIQTLMTFPLPILKRKALSTLALLSNTWVNSKNNFSQQASISASSISQQYQPAVSASSISQQYQPAVSASSISQQGPKWKWKFGWQPKKYAKQISLLSNIKQTTSQINTFCMKVWLVTKEIREAKLSGKQFFPRFSSSVSGKSLVKQNTNTHKQKVIANLEIHSSK